MSTEISPDSEKPSQSPREKLLSPYSTSQELQTLYDDISSAFESEIITPLELAYLKAAQWEFLKESYDVEGTSELGTRIWENLKENTDIPHHWALLDPELGKSGTGIFHGTLNSLGSHSTFSISTKKSKSAGGGQYSPSDRRIVLFNDDQSRRGHTGNNIRVLHRTLMNSLNGYFHTDEYAHEGGTMEPLALISHEMAHDSTSSLWAVRHSAPIKTLLVNYHLLKGKDPKKVKDYGTRSEMLEVYLANTAMGMFLEEAIADIANLETGSRVSSESYTSERVTRQDSPYEGIIKANPDLKELQTIERKLLALSASIGWDSTSMGRIIRQIIIGEFEASQSDSMGTFANPGYVISLLDDLILSSAKISGVDAVDKDQMEQELAERARLKSAVRFLLQQKAIITTATFAVKERIGFSPMKVMLDNVYSTEVESQIEVNGYVFPNIPIENGLLGVRLTETYDGSSKDKDTLERKYKKLKAEFEIYYLREQNSFISLARDGIDEVELDTYTLTELGKKAAEQFQKHGIKVHTTSLLPETEAAVTNPSQYDFIVKSFVETLLSLSK